MAGLDVRIPAAAQRVEAESKDVHVERRKPAFQKPKAIQYFVRHNLAVFFDYVLTELYLHLPPNPIDFLTQVLLKHAHYTELIEHYQGPPKELVHRADVKDYAARMKIPQLLEAILADILREEPEEPDKYILSWLRWNRAGFLRTHFPEGAFPHLVQKGTPSKAKEEGQ
eukprot:TRINITY_DN30372_c0_g1_i1.p1 TRINITY_DN30372_c0_g1~~TRINITY_DN30372_c0_g1_i1.p1  ORF type:complete len:169 (+),score=53.76 TRINITY_DN30372_c0_g1_i1:132-638(+)